MTAVLETEGVVAGYGSVDILHGISIALQPGEFIAIIGPNGAGKSTLLKAVFGLVSIRRGRVLLEGRDITGTPPEQMVALGVSYVPQTENIFPTLSVRENLEMGGYLRRDGLRRRTSDVLALFPDLAGRLREAAGRLSGGQRQMLALARGLMLDPRVLLLDEPSAGLSPALVDSVFAKVLEINRRGTAVVLVEQNARQALSFSHRAYVLAMGENRLEGEAKSLLANEDVGRVYLGV